MGNTKSLVFVITSLTFLVSGATCSQLFVQPIFAANPHYCFEHDCGGDRVCDNDPKKGTATCCFRDPGTIPQSTTCQTCHVNTSTGEFENCTSASKGKPGAGVIAPPPSGVAPPTTPPKITPPTAEEPQGIAPETEQTEQTEPEELEQPTAEPEEGMARIPEGEILETPEPEDQDSSDND